MSNPPRPATLNYCTPQAIVRRRGLRLGDASLLLAVVTLAFLVTSSTWLSTLRAMPTAPNLFVGFVVVLNAASWLCGFVAGHTTRELDTRAFSGWLLSSFNVLVILAVLYA